MNLKTLQATVCLLCCSIVLTAQNEDKLIGAFNGQKSIADSLFFANMMESNLPLRSVVEGDDMSEGYNNGSITTNITGVTAHGFGYPVSPTISNSEPGTSVGGMGASFGVSPMGGATCSIPIEVPVGVGGLQPQLAIVYNSQSGNGLAGYGTNLTGLSAITRGPKDIYHDGVAKSVTYLADDALYLDGVRLILTYGHAGQDGATYYPESDPFTEVTAHGTCTSSYNDIWFEVHSSDGMVYWYGADYSSRLSYTINNSQRIHSWYITRAVQPVGNYISYTYNTPDGYSITPAAISYGTNSNYPTRSLSNVIQFAYENRRDSIPIAFDGRRGSLKKRLKTITCRTGDDVFRTYTLDYDTVSDGTTYKYSRLTTITESNGQNESLPATRLNWSYLPSISYAPDEFLVFPPTNLPPGSNITFQNQSYLSGDMNADGIDDVIGLFTLHDSAAVEFYYGNKGSNGQMYYEASGPCHMMMGGSPMPVWRSYMKGSVLTDIDGNGTNEILFPFYTSTRSDNGILDLYVVGDTYDSNGFSFLLQQELEPLCTTGDLTNNGRSEIVLLEMKNLNGFYRLNIFGYNDMYSPGVNDSLLIKLITPHYDLSLPSDPKQIYISDMNGDGMNDLFIICEEDYKIFWNKGSFQFAATEDNDHEYNWMTTVGDFNGDGLLDVLTHDGSDNIYFNINNGNGSFSRMLAYDLNLPTLLNPFLIYNLSHCNTVDFDADGMMDVIMTMPLLLWVSPMEYSSIIITYWMRSTGSSLVPVYYTYSDNMDDGCSDRYLTGDFDGDGHTELVNYGYDCALGSSTSTIWRVYRNSNLTKQTGKVISMTGDYGVTTLITYSTLADGIIYSRSDSATYPLSSYAVPLNVVKTTQSSNGASGSETSHYYYKGLRVHSQGRGIVGYDRCTVYNEAKDEEIVSGVSQWDTLFFIPRISYTRTNVGNASALNEVHISINNKGNRRYFAYPSYVVDVDMDGDSVFTLRYYDTGTGFLEREVTMVNNSMYKYVTNMFPTLVGGVYRPQLVEIGQIHPDEQSVFKSYVSYSYSSNGLVTQRKDNYQSSTNVLTTDYTYDTWGNMTSETSSGNGITPCTTFYEYDDKHRFPVRVYTNPASSVMKYTYDIWGNVLSEQDSINSLITNTVTHTYDGWGNLQYTYVPGGGYVTYTRGWNDDSTRRWYILEQGTARPWVKTWYDNRGREVRTESVGPMNVNILNTTAYNSKGQVTGRTETTGSLSLNSTYTYDDHGRVVTETVPGHGTKTYSYGTAQGGQKTVTVSDMGDDNTSRSTTYIYDAWGNLKSVEDSETTVTNMYFSQGGISSTTASGATWTFTYDNCGNRISMSDPDAGTTTYEYDALGREISRTDARGVTYVTNYDYLGRVTSTTAFTPVSSETITYTYGDANAGTGQMKLIGKALNTWTYSYEYDQYGRMTKEYLLSYETSYQYSDVGLVTRKTYPDGRALDYTYDAYGNHTGTNAVNGAVQWSRTGYTGTSATSSVTLGYTTPFTRTTQYDSNGSLQSQQLSRGGTTLMSNSYTFSSVTGNLTSRTMGAMTETFIYDDMDRQTEVLSGNQTQMHMDYTGNGNIEFKTGIGLYEYSSNTRPHAVTAVANTAGLIPDGTQTVDYNLWGKVSDVYATVGNDTYHYKIQYGPDLQRVFSELWKNNTEFLHFTFYDGGYEQRYADGQINYTYCIDGAGSTVALYTNHTQTGVKTYCLETDHLGSVTGLYDQNGNKAFSAIYDVWGKRTVATGSIEYYRGFTGHEHIDQIGLIDMNGRMYDPLLGRFLSPDPFVQTPDNSQNYNRYSYCLNNPLKYTDPRGESIVGGIIIGSIIGAYSGGVLANEGILNPGKWKWESDKTWGYMTGGLLTGALSGAIGAAIASSSIPMANTLSIMGGSLTNSLGTYTYTGGKTDITMSFGFCSYNFTTKKWNTLGMKGNCFLEDIGYALGAMGNLGDVLMLGRNIGDVDVITDPHGEGHSSIVRKNSIGRKIYQTDENKGIVFDNDKIISVGPDNSDVRSWLWKRGHNKWYTHAADNYIWRETIKLNKNHLYKYASFLDELERSGKLIYSAPLSSCVTHASIALNLSGILNIGIHPVVLHTQLYLRNMGIRPSLYSYYLLK